MQQQQQLLAALIPMLPWPCVMLGHNSSFHVQHLQRELHARPFKELACKQQCLAPCLDVVEHDVSEHGKQFQITVHDLAMPRGVRGRLDTEEADRTACNRPLRAFIAYVTSLALVR
jgi:hypothetical protein